MTENIITLDKSDATAKPLIDSIRAAVNSAAKYRAYVEAHKVTRDTVKDHARALAVLAYPHEKPVQKVDGARTKFGNAVQAAGNGLRGALDAEEEKAKPVALRATLSGEGGGSTVIPADHPLYGAIVALIHGESTEQAA